MTSVCCCEPPSLKRESSQNYIFQDVFYKEKMLTQETKEESTSAKKKEAIFIGKYQEIA